jgi:NTP pyrophosphatase (non-canonical NTP hydrolase)
MIRKHTIDPRTNKLALVSLDPSSDVMDFMIAMGQPPNALSDFARIPAKDLALATQLMFGTGDGAKKGEVYEMLEAWDAYKEAPSLENLTEFVDGAIDSIYVILWTLHKLGVPVHLAWTEVQDSNMAKLVDGKPLKNPETGKIMKPEGWKPPDLFGLLQAAASRENYKNGVASHD